MPSTLLHFQDSRSRTNMSTNSSQETMLPDFKTLLEDLTSGPETFFWSSPSSSSSLLGSPYCGGTDEVLNPCDEGDDTSGLLNDALDLGLHPSRLDSFNDIWGKSMRWTDEYRDEDRLDDNDCKSINSTLEREVQFKIECACAKLHISSNPRQWTQEEVRSWIRYSLRKFNSPSYGAISEQDWLFDGEQFCRLPLREFELRLPYDAEILFAELESWKIDHERRMNSVLPTYSTQNSSSISFLESVPSSNESVPRSSEEADLSYMMLDRMVGSTGQHLGSNNIVYTSMPRLCGGTSRYVSTASTDQIPLMLPPHTLQRFFDSLAVNTEKSIQMSLNNAYSDYVEALDRHVFNSQIFDINNNNHDNEDYNRNSTTQYRPSGDTGKRLLGGRSEDESLVRVKLELYNRDEDVCYGKCSVSSALSQSYETRCNVGSSEGWRDTLSCEGRREILSLEESKNTGSCEGRGDSLSDDDSWMQNVVSSAQLLSQDLEGQYEDRSRNWSECSNTYLVDKIGPVYSSQSSLSSSSTSSATSRRGKRTICLWQFLKELLLLPQSYQTWIRWLDVNRGIFKIEDSMRVAQLWGERKNRPAMNYDKLSRSIRQYYRKGIIQKTSNSKRLVYQFCPQYM